MADGAPTGSPTGSPNGPLSGRVALVTGASRGVGRGIAEVLVAAGATVHVTGRDATALASIIGAVPLPCDHTDDVQVEAVFARIAAGPGALDILVNNAWGGYERMTEGGEFTWSKPLWEQPLWRWDAMFTAGVRAAYVATTHAARLMVPRRTGLIVNISFWAARRYIGNVAYGMAKAATDKLTVDAAHELHDHGVTVVSLYPGLVRTESVLAAAAFMDLSNSESPQFTGRAIAALAADPTVARCSGQVLVGAQVARDYGFLDIDGRSPEPQTPSDH